MSDTSNAMEGLNLISDWSKWLITIEAGAITIVGTFVKLDKDDPPHLVKVLTTIAVICFLISIASVALLLLSLPEIAQNLQQNTNIWLTWDSIIGRVFLMNTQGFAVLESFFFGLGMVCFVASIVAVTWLPRVPIGTTTLQTPLPTPVPVGTSGIPVAPQETTPVSTPLPASELVEELGTKE